eukprot:TRINITY_DN19711_c0_g1_i6.p2 TRINITY_DN19711_c0_g1~~TRINITY_DN19711_c0_g1_i6.p2  ORF type:complete len:124 (-),score=11.25 TRINITY_DN19711_c0_g1_i6:70-405(-)
MKAKVQYFVMKKGIVPDRADLRNSEGGCWALFIPVEHPNGKEMLDNLWLTLCREVVNRKFPQDDIICGVGVAVRKTQTDYPMRIDEFGVQRFDPSQINRDRVELWTCQAYH